MSVVTPINNPTTIGGANPPLLRTSYEEYLAWEHEGGLTEWVDAC